MRTFALLLVLCAALLAQAAQNAEIPEVLNQQAEAWNRGDLEGYMRGYWNSPELTFFSGATVTRGWQPTLERYRKRYQGEGKEMGKLEFSDITIQPLARRVALVRGRWRLTLSSGKQPNGLFTLMMRRFPEGWRITHDHSSGEN